MQLRTYDLHTHILPGLDDGSPDSEVSQAMLRMAAESGTTDLFATPHIISGSYLPAWNTIRELVDALNRFAQEQSLNITVHPGAEVAMDWSLLALLPAPGPFCLGGGRFILIELPLGSLPVYADEFLFTLQARDFLPVLGHPERNPDVKKNPALLQHWLEQGIFTQMNASSLMGTMGSHTQMTALKLLETGQAHFLGSDAHGVGVRRPDLRSASETLGKLLGAEGARALLQTNPAALLEDNPEGIDGPCIAGRPKPGWAEKIRSLWKKK